MNETARPYGFVQLIVSQMIAILVGHGFDAEPRPEGGHHGPQRAAKSDEDAAQDMWGQRFAAAAALPLGAERYVSAGSAGDLVAGVLTNRVFDRASLTSPNEHQQNETLSNYGPEYSRRARTVAPERSTSTFNE